MTGENVHHFRRGIPNKFRNNFKSLISEKVKEVLTDGDFLFLNFESALAGSDELSELPIEEAVYVAPLETIELLKSLDIPIVANVANNHFAQHGKAFTDFTVDQLQKNGITVIGQNNEPVCLARNGIMFNIWGVSLVHDKSEPSLYFRSSYENLISDLLLKEKEVNEIRILSIHWGEEYHTMPSLKQKELAVALSNAGFDLILGHHPHTIQTAEKAGKTWVLYSHGNFIFDQNFSSLTQKGLISRTSLPDGETELFITQQKHFKVVDLKQVTVDKLYKFCSDNHSGFNPLKMRVKMKTELVTHFYELNMPIIKTFAGRLFS